MTDTRLRLTILGGYLGSGKTTWLRHQLHVGAFGPRVHVVVNEAAEVPVDDVLLIGAEGMTLLAGGCCCCAGRDDLIAALRGLCDARSRLSADQPRLQRIVLETSGLADPGAIVAAIQSDPVLINHIVVDETIVAVDALHALAQLATEPLGRRQVGAADRLVLTKTDACETSALDTLRATLATLNGHATMSAAVLGEPMSLPPLSSDVGPFALPALSDEDARGPIQPTQVAIPDGMDWSAFTLWLSALLHARGEDLVRVKGVVRTPAGRLLLQTVRKVVQSPEILPEREDGKGDDSNDNRIVFIGRGYRPPDLARSLNRFLGLPPPPETTVSHPMSAITIRPLRAEDRADWVRLWTGYLDYYKTTVPEAVYDSTFARLLGDDPQDFSCLIAEMAGRPVGLVHFLFHRHCWKIENVCYLQDLYADPEVRGAGVGRALIEAVYAAADANGTPAVYWLTQDFNETARRLYDRIAQVTPFIRYNRKL